MLTDKIDMSHHPAKKKKGMTVIIYKDIFIILKTKQTKKK